MLGNSNTLNTRLSSKANWGKPSLFYIDGWANNIFYCENVKDITMDNQQETFTILGILRDYTREIIVLLWLRYSPIFFNDMNYTLYNFMSVNKSLKKKNLSTSSRAYAVQTRPQNSHKLDPNWVTGFVDAEGCFSVIIDTSSNPKGKVRISFEINLHEKDQDILYEIKAFFGVGSIYHRSDRKKSIFRVTNINFINDFIIPHFRNYPLISKKHLDFVSWSKVVDIILNKEHSTEEGFTKILALYASINTGVSKKVSTLYPNIVPATKPEAFLPDSLNPQWVSGFVSGDGGFSIYVRPAKDYVLGEKVYCRFHIAQHSKDLELMKLFINFFSCGSVSERSSSATLRCDYIVQDVTNLVEKILPHFDKYPILNLKQEDYKCFKECIAIIVSKQHLTKEGLNRIKVLNSEMNTNRLKD